MSKNFSRHTGEADAPNRLLDEMLAELRNGEENANLCRMEKLREQVLKLGTGYHFALLARLRRITQHEQALQYSALLHWLGDGRLIEPLKELAVDDSVSSEANSVAGIALIAAGVEPPMPAGAPDASEFAANSDAVQDALDALMVQVDNGDAGDVASAILALGTRLDSPVSLVLLKAMTANFQERSLPVLIALAEMADSRNLTVLAELAAQISHPTAVTFLQQLQTRATDAATREQIHASLALLRQAGITKAAPLSDLPVPAASERWTIERAALTGMDGVGSRMMFLLCRRDAKHGLSVQFCLNDTVGMKDCAGAEGSWKKMERKFEEMFDQIAATDLMALEADVEYCHWLLHEALELNRSAEFPPPYGYSSWIQPLGPPPRRFERPFIYESIDPASIHDAPGLLRQSADLIDAPSSGAWLLEYKQVEPFAKRINFQEVAGYWDRLTTTNPPPAPSIVLETVAALTTDEQQRIWQRRLEEMAYLYELQDCLEDADMAVVVATELSKGKPAHSIPFIHALITQNLLAARSLLDSGESVEFLDRTPRDPIP
jgi:hypothetical protein